MFDLTNLSLEQLKELQDKVKSEIESRMATQNLAHCHFKTDELFSPAKHGNAYIAIIKKNNGKITRDFIPWSNRIWDSSKKNYRAEWAVDLPVGTKLEARLTEGSWKNDYKSYFIIQENGPVSASQDKVFAGE